MKLPHLLLNGLLTVATPAAAIDVTLEVVPRWRGADIAVPSTHLLNDAGQRLRLTRFAAMLSNATLVRADGGSVRLDGQFGFINAEEKRLAWTLRNVPEGDYVGLGFEIGVPPETNHADPAKWPAGHPLNPLINGLHWGWQGGYVFAAFEGKWSEAVDAAREVTAERGFSYHLATDARRMTVGFRANFHVKENTRVDLALDLSRVLAAQRLVANDRSESTHSAEGDELAQRLAFAMERAWFWLEVRPALRAGRDTIRVANGPLGERALLAATSLATPYAFTVPATFPQPSLPADNPLTVEGVALGALLFGDRRLSGNSRQSCADCHAPTRAFSDAVALSHGADGSVGRRNAMPLFNLAWSGSYAWDGSQPKIRDQARAAWTNPIEMAGKPDEIIAKLSSDAELSAKFRAAFGAGEITAQRVTLALEQYLLTIVSADSKFDRALHGDAEFTEQEKRGFELFVTEYDPARGSRGADCFHCHGGALFTDSSFKNNGSATSAADRGRERITGLATDAGKFKTPSLRNVGATAPYMHDGRFATLEEVVAHYDHGVQRSSTLDPNLAKHPAEGLSLSVEDRRALVAFLRTLTDVRFEASTAAVVVPTATFNDGR